ncbi:uncharacterized protein BDR25DRAFT_351483 [Lindgomyces ingoldianus]|uniref:Uncharacterized protein n=1 Tax=Lindgomyces ingoldianus TaxID=673940 RepID=A0ACB6R954_9PLEO|nr:uncharacterized protein BDR25DRAFT_351483 [Lindgomyces ingoldianus]KAF2474996.1 hypothetical protein BDR25DRAFT_351483 [Lindgomyces ingoldianus]
MWRRRYRPWRVGNGHGWILEVDERTAPPASENLAKPLNQPYKSPAHTTTTTTDKPWICSATDPHISPRTPRRHRRNQWMSKAHGKRQMMLPDNHSQSIKTSHQCGWNTGRRTRTFVQALLEFSHITTEFAALPRRLMHMAVSDPVISPVPDRPFKLSAQSKPPLLGNKAIGSQRLLLETVAAVTTVITSFVLVSSAFNLIQMMKEVRRSALRWSGLKLIVESGHHVGVTVSCGLDCATRQMKGGGALCRGIAEVGDGEGFMNYLISYPLAPVIPYASNPMEEGWADSTRARPIEVT